MNCAFCGEKLNIEGKVMRRDTCTHCGRDLRCCVQCKFYDPHAYNDCREVMAERIADNQRANTCEYYVLKGSSGGPGDRRVEAKKALEALFKK
ncbi:MAG: hypothetical protein HQ561_11590 [Desulfobacteraceae bacterium]|nr:hypothetical protein [Desulfobacteraceae bacterium]